MCAMRAEMTELECCPQCAGRLLEALDAAGLDSGAGCAAGTGLTDGCGCAEDCACAQPDRRSRIPIG